MIPRCQIKSIFCSDFLLKDFDVITWFGEVKNAFSNAVHFTIDTGKEILMISGIDKQGCFPHRKLLFRVLRKRHIG